jgi:hypothetical protein
MHGETVKFMFRIISLIQRRVTQNAIKYSFENHRVLNRKIRVRYVAKLRNNSNAIISATYLGHLILW